MNYKEKYETALEGIREILSSGQDSIKMSRLQLRLQGIFPELNETDDEKIRKVISDILLIDSDEIREILDVNNVLMQDINAWLEKQGEQNYKIIKGKNYLCTKTHKYAGAEWIEGVKYYSPEDYSLVNQGCTYHCPKYSKEEHTNLFKEVEYDGCLEKQGEKKSTDKIQFGKEYKCIASPRYSTFMIGKIYKPEDKFLCRFMNFCSDCFEPIEDSEPKFKVGDWIVCKDRGVFLDGRKFAQITKIEGEKHWFDTAITYLKAEDIRLWTLEDAEDGDILYSKKHNLLWRYKNTKECYCCINLNYDRNNISIGNEIVIPNDVRPATQEQRDLLFDKMLQHTFSEINNKKELKKQGEHNPTDNDDKIEPKFHEGDWVVVSGEVILICDIRNNLYDVMFADGEHRHYDTNILDKESRLWTIADAKDGDVLVASDDSIFIFAGVAYCACKYYVALTVYNDVSISKDVELSSWEMSNAVHPATKEQCDHLFKVMKEKGYKWCNEKKELKKIGELTSTDIANKPEPMFKVGEWVVRKDKQHFCNGSKTVQIIKIDRNMCDFDCGSWLYDKDIRPWSIYDAQVGDVLISWTNKPFIYNGFFNESVVGAYCGLNTFNRIIIADKQDYLYYNWTIKKDIRPATKEQRDFLFKKMKESGYEWDSEKKELIRRT